MTPILDDNEASRKHLTNDDNYNRQLRLIIGLLIICAIIIVIFLSLGIYRISQEGSLPGYFPRPWENWGENDTRGWWEIPIYKKNLQLAQVLAKTSGHLGFHKMITIKVPSVFE